MAERALIRFAKDAEDVASGLHTFRDNLPRIATRITGTIGELFTISSVLREIDNAQGDPMFAPSFHRVRDDLALVFPSLQSTLDAAFGMFARSRKRPHQMVWDDLTHKMDQEEGIGLLERLEWYHDFLRAQLDVLLGYQPRDLRDLRRQLITLWDAQRVSILRSQRQFIDTSGMRSAFPAEMQSRFENNLTKT